MLNLRVVVACIGAVTAAFLITAAMHALALRLPDSDTGAIGTASTSSTGAGLPTRLKIPSLDIDARVQQVGINKKGEMGIPDNFRDVAWYAYGPAPGEKGSAVIDGHVDNALALSGVFKRLHEVRAGDEVIVVTESGAQLRFIVVDVQTYPYADVPLDLIFTRADAARLNLITCAGTWVSGLRTYDKRTVVYTIFSNAIGL